MAVEPTTKYQKKEINEADFWCLIGQPIQHLPSHLKLAKIRKIHIFQIEMHIFGNSYDSIFSKFSLYFLI